MKLAILISALCSASCTPEPAKRPASATTLLAFEIRWTDYYSRAYGVPVDFVQAVIDVESAWRPYVLSAKGAAGIMQLMPRTAASFGVTNRFRADENIRGGIAYIAYLMHQFGDLRLVAAAYYAGEQRIKRQGLRCSDPDICRYVRDVQRRFAKRQAAARAGALNLKRGEHQ